ncbi:uncharacterized protein LOC113674887 [Pocillopora damicornis]|uniref:uncharacterized protein LOC113674887 n=1 Tax=Pocillopora damicornis TaxID=46731 RepID=UPI000F54CF29|nr:uncharacterized protein LOC113674887 [Pocillopora damicornis]
MSIVFGGREASPAHFKSGVVEDSALDLFTVPPTNITYNGYRIVEINPTSESITPIEFVIPGSREYIDFSRGYFRMDLILKKTDGGNLAAASQRWLAPNAFHAIIKQPSIYVNGTLTTEQTDTYAYKAYLETILNYGTEDEETILRPQGMLIPGVDLKMSFTLNDPKFFMNGLAAVATKVRLQAARLQKNLDVYYPTVRSEIRTYTLQNNHTNFEATDVFNGRVPDRVVVGLVYQDAFSGNYAYNPFNFPKFDVSSIKQIVEGEEYPYQPLQLIADNGQYDMSGYHRLISAKCSAYRGKCMSNQNIGETINIPHYTCGIMSPLDVQTVYN